MKQAFGQLPKAAAPAGRSSAVSTRRWPLPALHGAPIPVFTGLWLHTVNPYCLGLVPFPKKSSSSGLFHFSHGESRKNLQAFMTVTRKGHNPTYCNFVFRARPVPKFRPLFFNKKNEKLKKWIMTNHSGKFSETNIAMKQLHFSW